MKNIVKKVLLIAVLCKSSLLLFSQKNIEINVFDENKEPISYSNVALYNSNDNSLIAGTTTSSNGIAIFKNVEKNSYKLCIMQ